MTPKEKDKHEILFRGSKCGLSIYHRGLFLSADETTLEGHTQR